MECLNGRIILSLWLNLNCWMNRKSNRSGFKCVRQKFLMPCSDVHRAYTRVIRKHVIKRKLMRTKKPKNRQQRRSRHFSALIFLRFRFFSLASPHCLSPSLLHSFGRFSFCAHFNLSTASIARLHWTAHAAKHSQTNGDICIVLVCAPLPSLSFFLSLMSLLRGCTF